MRAAKKKIKFSDKVKFVRVGWFTTSCKLAPSSDSGSRLSLLSSPTLSHSLSLFGQAHREFSFVSCSTPDRRVHKQQQQQQQVRGEEEESETKTIKACEI